MAHGEESGEARPLIAAYFADPDEAATLFLTALGQAIVAAAALEGNLRLELTRLLFAAQTGQEASGGKTLGEQVAELENLTAGRLLSRLRERGLPDELERRISDAISRRNRMVHRLFEDPQLVKAMAGTGVADEAVATLQQLALDCAALSAELHLFAMPKIETSIGASKEELLDFVLSLDPAQIQQELEREQVEALQELGNASDWAPGELWGLNTHHRITVSWQGEQVETLADLLRPGLRAVCIGINPSPVSVTAGHYYQGPIGRRFWQRLQRAGVIEETGTGREDDAAFLAGIGFTDIVKRPTTRANEITAAELEKGRELLTEKLRRHRPALLIFTFKKTATSLFGRFKGHGHRPELELGDAQVFVMPGPYERADRVGAALEQLRSLLAE
jgi:TDG/mug DNA glycosylase family protein